MREDNYLDTMSTENITCPYCGHEEGDSWEVRDDDGERDCDSCGKIFKFQRNIQVSYSTQKMFEDCEHTEASEYQGFFSCNDCGTFKRLTENPQLMKILENLSIGEKDK